MNKESVECKKCGQMFNCDRHHILPKALFGEGETEPLCPNCHREYHDYLGHKYLRKENKQPMEFYLHKYYKWFYGAGIIALIIIVGKMIF